jgi:hypothetical protein
MIGHIRGVKTRRDTIGGSEEDLAGLIVWLASNSGGYINGNILLTDGGRSTIYVYPNYTYPEQKHHSVDSRRNRNPTTISKQDGISCLLMVVGFLLRLLSTEWCFCSG